MTVQILVQVRLFNLQLSHKSPQRVHNLVEPNLCGERKTHVQHTYIITFKNWEELTAPIHYPVDNSVLTATYSGMVSLSSDSSFSAAYFSSDSSRSLKLLRRSPARSHSWQFVSSSCFCLSMMLSISCFLKACCFLHNQKISLIYITSYQTYFFGHKNNITCTKLDIICVFFLLEYELHILTI